MGLGQALILIFKNLPVIIDLIVKLATALEKESFKTWVADRNKAFDLLDQAEREKDPIRRRELNREALRRLSGVTSRV